MLGISFDDPPYIDSSYVLKVHWFLKVECSDICKGIKPYEYILSVFNIQIHFGVIIVIRSDNNILWPFF